MSQPPGPPPYQGPGYGPGYQAGVVTNGKATAALVTGITTLVLSWCCGFGLLGAVAIALGMRARTEIARSGGRQDGDGLALAGIITGAVAAVVALAVLVIIGITLASSDFNQYGRSG
jgi:hypothetical protein